MKRKIVTQFLSKAKDGGVNSPVDGYFLIEIKSLFSIVLLKFNKGRREQYHTHAFNAFTWFLSGELVEERFNGVEYKYTKSLIPKLTSRANNHRVKAAKNSWCLSIRGNWANEWTESDLNINETITLTHGRKIIKKEKIK